MPFDYEEYERKCRTLSPDALQKEWENYTRQISGGATSTAGSVLFAPITGGASLVGLGLSAPRIHNARKKREIIEACLQSHGTTHNTRKRDVFIPMGIAGTLGGVTLGLAGPGADMIAGHVVGHGVEYAMSHAALEVAGASLEHQHDEHKKTKEELIMIQKTHVETLQAQSNFKIQPTDQLSPQFQQRPQSQQSFRTYERPNSEQQTSWPQQEPQWQPPQYQPSVGFQQGQGYPSDPPQYQPQAPPYQLKPQMQLHESTISYPQSGFCGQGQTSPIEKHGYQPQVPDMRYPSPTPDANSPGQRTSFALPQMGQQLVLQWDAARGVYVLAEGSDTQPPGNQPVITVLPQMSNGNTADVQDSSHNIGGVKTQSRRTSQTQVDEMTTMISELLADSSVASDQINSHNGHASQSEHEYYPPPPPLRTVHSMEHSPVIPPRPVSGLGYSPVTPLLSPNSPYPPPPPRPHSSMANYQPSQQRPPSPSYQQFSTAQGQDLRQESIPRPHSQPHGSGPPYLQSELQQSQPQYSTNNYPPPPPPPQAYQPQQYSPQPPLLPYQPLEYRPNLPQRPAAQPVQYASNQNNPHRPSISSISSTSSMSTLSPVSSISSISSASTPMTEYTPTPSVYDASSRRNSGIYANGMQPGKGKDYFGYGQVQGQGQNWGAGAGAGVDVGGGKGMVRNGNGQELDYGPPPAVPRAYN